jgi:hypothetical protein
MGAQLAKITSSSATVQLHAASTRYLSGAQCR